MFRIIVHNEDLKTPTSTKFKKIEDFGLDETEDLVNTVDYHVSLDKSEMLFKV